MEAADPVAGVLDGIASAPQKFDIPYSVFSISFDQKNRTSRTCLHIHGHLPVQQKTCHTAGSLRVFDHFLALRIRVNLSVRGRTVKGNSPQNPHGEPVAWVAPNPPEAA